MIVKDQLTEPWGIVCAVLLGGLGGAVTAAVAPAGLLAVPVGLGIAGIVYGVKVGLGVLTDRALRPAAKPDPGLARLPTPPRGSPADRWLRRAEAAVVTLHRQTETPDDFTLRTLIADIDDQAAGALGDLRRFAGQVTLVERAVSGIDLNRLRHESAAIEQSLSGLPAGPLRDERRRARSAVADQVDVARRLSEVRDTLVARMQSSALGLEGHVARLAELLALHATTASGSLVATRIAELTNDLEGMRAGLAEAEQVSRSVLAADPGDSSSGGKAERVPDGR